MELKTKMLNDKKITYTEVEISWEGKKEAVQVKKLSFGEMLDLLQISTKMNIVSGQTNFQLDQQAMSVNCLLKSVVLAPFPITAVGVRDLDNELGQYLCTVFSELNTPNDKKKEI